MILRTPSPRSITCARFATPPLERTFNVPRQEPLLLRRAALVAVLVSVLCAGAARSAGERVIQYRDDALTVRVSEVAVSEILDELGRQAGAHIRGEVQTPHDVSVAFEAVPLSDALHRLLGEQNFALVYGAEGRLKSVRLLGGASPTSASPAAATPPAAGAGTQPGEALESILAQRAPVPVTGRLADALGGQTVGLQQLGDVAIHYKDPVVRVDAMRTLINAMDTDPVLLATLTKELDTLDDDTLSAILRAAAGDRAADIAFRVSREAHADNIRDRASAVLTKLRAGR
jgi:hypothetical protein